MADVIQFPPRNTRAELFAKFTAAVHQLEDIAESLAEPGTCEYGQLLRLFSRLLVEKRGVAAAIDLLETAQFYVTSLPERTPPGGAA